MLNRLFILLIGIAFAGNLKSQSIAKSWYSEKDNICLVMDSTNHRVNIDEFYDRDEKITMIKYKVVGDRLKITWKARQLMFPLGWTKDISWLDIVKLTNDQLVLKFYPSEDGSLGELFGTYDEVTFDAKPTDCEGLVKTIKK